MKSSVYAPVQFIGPRLPLRVSKLALLSLSVPFLLAGCTVCCPRMTPAPSGASPNEVVQEFPSAGSAETAWRVRWGTGRSRGLYITGAWFRRAPGQPWIQVIYDARLADIFVPYHPGSPRYYDLTGFGFDLVQTSSRDAGCCGALLGTPPVVVKEVRDRGVLWKDDAAVRRGEELVLWGTLNAANYNYVMQYGFRDDGTVSLRLGATARNLPGMETVPHMHNALWRVDVDLGGSLHDSPVIMRHLEPVSGPSANDVEVPYNAGREGSVDWDPREFTMVRILDTVQQNGRGNKISYDLMAMREGSARHLEAFSQHDFWITRYRSTELNYTQLPTYVANSESVTDTDVVLWCLTPMHHHPRDEDGRYAGGVWSGVALAMWSGFDLRPRNLFGETPLHP